jgi:hypothetical protein
MRKMMLLAFIAAWKLGWAKLQVPASERPLTVNRSSTPPLGALVFAEPFELKKNGNRASRVGPLAVMNDGVVSLGATLLPANPNWGLVAGPLPPIAGCVWQETHETELKRGPKPLLPAGLLETDSTS